MARSKVRKEGRLVADFKGVVPDLSVLADVVRFLRPFPSFVLGTLDWILRSRRTFRGIKADVTCSMISLRDKISAQVRVGRWTQILYLSACSCIRRFMIISVSLVLQNIVFIMSMCLFIICKFCLYISFCFWRSRSFSPFAKNVSLIIYRYPDRWRSIARLQISEMVRYWL